MRVRENADGLHIKQNNESKILKRIQEKKKKKVGK